MKIQSKHRGFAPLFVLSISGLVLGCSSADTDTPGGDASDVGSGGTGTLGSGGVFQEPGSGGSSSTEGDAFAGGNTASGGERSITSGGALSSGGDVIVPGGSGGDETGSGGLPAGTGGLAGGFEHDLIGWASVSACGPEGTTGGGDGPPTVTVTSSSELVDALGSDGPLVVAVSGKISAPESVSGVEDKTLIGVNGAEISGGITFSGSRNVIIKNILFSDGSGGSGDTFELTGSQCFWFDHCEFRDGSDGNLDIVRASDFVTVSWSKFYYTRGHDHMLSNLTGNGDNRSDDVGKLSVTFHHNWWGAGVKERMPRVRYGKVHVFNNYYKYEPVSGDAGQNYCVAAGQHADLLVENNYFDGSDDPIIYQTNGEGTAEVTERGNQYVGTTGSVVSTGGAFTPPYSYTADAGAEVKDIVMSGAGVQ